MFSRRFIQSGPTQQLVLNFVSPRAVPLKLFQPLKFTSWGTKFLFSAISPNGPCWSYGIICMTNAILEFHMGDQEFFQSSVQRQCVSCSRRGHLLWLAVTSNSWHFLSRASWLLTSHLWLTHDVVRAISASSKPFLCNFLPYSYLLKNVGTAMEDWQRKLTRV